MRYPQYKGPIEYINGDPYQIVARFPITSVKDPRLIKEWLGCDTTFRSNRENLFVFCNQIEEASWENI